MVKGIIYVSMRLTLLAPMILALSSCGNGGGSEEVVSNNVPKLSWDPPITNADGTTILS